MATKIVTTSLTKKYFWMYFWWPPESENQGPEIHTDSDPYVCALMQRLQRTSHPVHEEFARHRLHDLRLC